MVGGGRRENRIERFSRHPPPATRHLLFMANLIEPRTLKGFRDYLPAVMIPREQMLEKARQVYRSYGFAPIDTPALEYAEILLGKGGEESDRLVYRFKDHGDRDVALRFDLTVPFARFAAPLRSPSRPS